MTKPARTLAENAQSATSAVKSSSLPRACVPHVQHHFPASIVLFLPDAGVFAVFDRGFAVLVLGVKLVGARGVPQIARCGNVGIYRRPDQLVVLVVEEAHGA